MRLLLISDTHGKLGIINELAAHVRADAVIHAGDFGFFDDGSLERLSDQEIRLHVAHSDLPRTEKTRILALSRNDLIEESRKHRLLGGFQSFIDGHESFHIPVYAVWANHEDKDVIDRLFCGDVTVDNLHILHHRQGYRVGPAFVCGPGGNLLPGSKMMQRPIAGGGGKIWSTLSQFEMQIRSPLRNRTVKHDHLKNGERENFESVSRSKTYFRCTNFEVYGKMRFSGRMENPGRNVRKAVTF